MLKTFLENVTMFNSMSFGNITLAFENGIKTVFAPHFLGTLLVNKLPINVLVFIHPHR